jgi:hypothetical protein
MSRTFFILFTTITANLFCGSVLKAGQNDFHPKIVIWFLNDNNGGGSSHLNAENKYKDEGKTKSLADDKVLYTINYSNSATLINTTAVEVVANIELNRNGKKFVKKIKQKITKDGEVKLIIFKGINLKIITTGINSGVT